ncbi:MAG: hypothetical protein JWR09_5315 [Mucilaginibacter sp.]|nr:hypothetical protein [Mucilaginibacter sp.]
MISPIGNGKLTLIEGLDVVLNHDSFDYRIAMKLKGDICVNHERRSTGLADFKLIKMQLYAI